MEPSADTIHERIANDIEGPIGQSDGHVLGTDG